MKHANLYLTIIHSEKLRNIVGHGGFSPYQIRTSTGMHLGLLGPIAGASEYVASNDDCPAPQPIRAESLLQRCRVLLRLKGS